MATRNTHEEFLRKIKDVEHIIGKIIIKEPYMGANVKILADAKYGEILASPFNLTSGRVPTILLATNKTQYFLNVLKDKHPQLYGEIKVKSEYKTAKTKILVSDKYGDCMVAPTDLLNGSRPSVKTATNKHEYFLNMLREKNPSALSLVFITQYSGNEIRLIVRDEFGDMETRPSNLLNGKIPTILSSTNKESYFTNKLAMAAPNVLEGFKVLKYFNSSKVLMKGKHGDVITYSSSLLKGHMPTTECAVDKTKYWVSQAKEKHDGFYTYQKVKYIDSNSKVCITCPIHGNFWQKPSIHLCRGCGCPTCASSRGEILIATILSKNNIDYISEHTFDDCRNIQKLPFDFYLPRYNILVEYDGRQHTEIVNFGGISDERAMENLKIIQFRDNIKNQYCIDNNIPLLRISYLDFDNIEEILTRELKLPTNLSNIATIKETDDVKGL